MDRRNHPLYSPLNTENIGQTVCLSQVICPKRDQVVTVVYKVSKLEKITWVCKNLIWMSFLEIYFGGKFCVLWKIVIIKFSVEDGMNERFGNKTSKT